MSFAAELQKYPTVFVRQRRELVELLGVETRNKYSIETENGTSIGFAAEQQKGLLGVLFRQFLGHWRRFDISIFDATRQLQLRAHHPFRFFFHRLDIETADGRRLGAVQLRFAIFSKKFDIEDAQGNTLMKVSSPIWRIWTFIFKKNDVEVAAVRKKWGGLIKEAFIDADSFAIEFTGAALTGEERLLLLAAGIFVDLQYFEKKGSGGGMNLMDAISPD